MQEQVVKTFWRRRLEVIEATVNFSEREIPLARLKKMICSLKGSMMMTFDTPGFMSKACELFVQELAIRSWIYAESHHRCVILDSDIAEAIATTECYDFLVDTLHDHWAEHSSAPPRPRQTGKRRRPGPGQSSTSPHIPIPSSPVPAVEPRMPLPFPFLAHQTSSLLAPTFTCTPALNGEMSCTNYITRGSNFFGNIVNNSGYNIVPSNIVASDNTSIGSTTPLPELPNISGTCFCISMGNANEHGIPAFNPLVPLQLSCLVPVANNNNPDVSTTIELSLIPPEGPKTNNTIHDSGTTNVNGFVYIDAGKLQQHEKETIVNHHQTILNESIDVETIVVDAAPAGGNKNNIDKDEEEIIDESLLDRFLEEIQTDEELLSQDTTSDDILPLVSTILNVEEYSIDEPHVLDGIFSAQAPTPTTK